MKYQIYARVIRKSFQTKWIKMPNNFSKSYEKAYADKIKLEKTHKDNKYSHITEYKVVTED